MVPARRWPVIPVLGVIQILTWGSSFYLLSVLAAPMSKDTGWPLGWVIGGLSVGLLVAGLVSPRVGAFIGQHGGRPVLGFAAVVLSLGLAVIGLAPNLPSYLSIIARSGRRLARPGLVAQALAPSLGAVVLTHAGADATYALLTVLAFMNIALALCLWRVR